MNGLYQWGWGPHFEGAFQPYVRGDHIPGRVVSGGRDLYLCQTATNEAWVPCRGRLRCADVGLVPAVGDWVVLKMSARPSVIEAILPRRSELIRKAAGRAVRPQILAANVDTALLFLALNGDFNLNRLERYAVVVRQGGVTPVIVLSKADLVSDHEAAIAGVRVAVPGVSIVTTSTHTGQGILTIASLMRGRTVVFLGSSGVGKSSVLNALLGSEHQQVKAIRQGDDHGRHTTNRRDLLRVPQGGLVIDTPGMRELAPWNAESALDDAFAEIVDLAERCRFSNCAHAREPGCAVQASIAEGLLDPRRLRNYQKVQAEQHSQQRRREFGPVARRPRM